jgi:hexosaminidase
MPIPNIKQFHRLNGNAGPASLRFSLDPAFEGVREGIAAMLGFGEAAAPVDGAAAEFLLNPSLAEEAYRIRAGDGGVFIEAGGAAAAVYAASVLRQLSMENGGIVPACEIADEPRFSWRGLSMDVCRHFFPLDTLKRLVGLMAFYRMNRLHLHLSDDQGFRFESERFPKLNGVGSFRESTLVKRDGVKRQDGAPHGGYYTKEELRELVRFCKARGIEIVPELDMPGHAVAMIASYPELTCLPCAERPIKVATSFGVSEFSKILLCAGNEGTFQFICGLLDEIMEVFPFSYVHLGGDEAVKENWAKCPKCRETMRREGLKNERELQGWFLSRVKRYLEGRGRKAIVWNDGLCKTLEQDTICQYWTRFSGGGARKAAAWVNRGGSMIASDFLHLYFDYPYAATPLEKTFRYEPALRGVKKTRRSGVLGAECAVWTEWIDGEEKLFFNTLPRLAAAAETMWRQSRGGYRDFLRRLQPHCALYERMGLNWAKDAGRSKPFFSRIRRTAAFLLRDTHAELSENMR